METILDEFSFLLILGTPPPFLALPPKRKSPTYLVPSLKLKYILGSIITLGPGYAWPSLHFLSLGLAHPAAPLPLLGSRAASG
jgi:hypothetical protein